MIIAHHGLPDVPEMPCVRALCLHKTTHRPSTCSTDSSEKQILDSKYAVFRTSRVGHKALGTLLTWIHQAEGCGFEFSLLQTNLDCFSQ